MRIATLNVMGRPLMTQRRVVHDVRRVTSEAGIVLWQEFSNPRYKKALHDLPDQWRTVWASTPIPISYRRERFEVLDKDRVRAHGGKRLVSPARFITWVKFRDRKTGIVFIVCNAHFVSAAWSPRPVIFRSWRQQNWGTHLADLEQLLEVWVEEGLPVFAGGDYNRRQPRIVGAGIGGQPVIYLAHGGIDQLFFIPSKAVNFKVCTLTRDSHFWSDHDARIARGRLYYRPRSHHQSA